MKKYVPHILIGLILLAAAVLLLTTEKDEPKFDDRISFRKHDKIPYGMYLAYEELKHLFPGATITAERKAPGLWDNISTYGRKQALIIISPQFLPDEYEMTTLMEFIGGGNDVWISTMNISYSVKKFLQCEITFQASAGGVGWSSNDSLKVSLISHPVGQRSSYSYPGKAFDSWFYEIDAKTTSVLGYNKAGQPNFIRLNAGTGKGNLFLQLAPLAFSNYFMLYQDNIAYYENALSYIHPDKNKLVWDEYYLSKKETNEKRPGWLSAIMSYPGFRWGFLSALFILLTYALMEIRRKQRIIPVINSPKNDSLDFVKTIGRLYHDKGDHHNLSRKMAAYFLEHVRSRYKLNTGELDETFVNTLQYKSGVDAEEIWPIVNFISALDEFSNVNDKQLAQFHKLLESFYQKA